MIIHDIKHMAKDNANFRNVIQTGVYSQLVLMSIDVRSEIGMETHETNDQILFIVDGEAEAFVGGEVQNVRKHDIVFVPAGTEHNIKNVGSEALKLYTVYSPPAHKDGTIHKTKEDAEKEEKEY